MTFDHYFFQIHLISWPIIFVFLILNHCDIHLSISYFQIISLGIDLIYFVFCYNIFVFVSNIVDCSTCSSYLIYFFADTDCVLYLFYLEFRFLVDYLPLIIYICLISDYPFIFCIYFRYIDFIYFRLSLYFLYLFQII